MTDIKTKQETEEEEGEKDYEHMRPLEEHPDFEDLDEDEKAEARRMFQEDPDQDVNEVIFNVRAPPAAPAAATPVVPAAGVNATSAASGPSYGRLTTTLLAALLPAWMVIR